MWPNPQFPADLVTFTEEILNGKLHLLCSETCKVRFEDFYENFSETLIGGNVGKGRDCFWNLLFDFEEALTSFKYEKFLIKFSSQLMLPN